MQISYKHITLVYSSPKYVAVILGCTCKCGYITTNRFECPKYGRIHVECKRCHDKETIILNRSVVYHFHMINYPLISGDLNFFLDKWEEDQAKTP